MTSKNNRDFKTLNHYRIQNTRMKVEIKPIKDYQTVRKGKLPGQLARCCLEGELDPRRSVATVELELSDRTPGP